jgi:hypothetical protein
MDIEGFEKPALLGLRQTLITHRPILVVEITIDPNSPVSIKGKAELDSLFPERYEFLIISEKSEPLTGKYFLEPIAGILRFDEAKQHNLVAYPLERKQLISPRGRQR